MVVLNGRKNEWVVKITNCPHCGCDLSGSTMSNISKRDAISILYNTIIRGHMMSKKCKKTSDDKKITDIRIQTTISKGDQYSIQWDYEKILI